MRSRTNRANLTYEKIKETGNLSYTQARIWEQKEINKYGLKQPL